MGLYFGTDGLRGKINEEISSDIAYKVGNALGTIKPNAKVIIGGDTRKSRNLLTLSVCSGLINAGVDVVDVGICPTAGISYLTTKLGYDYGVVISASHNLGEYNGIKIFDKTGKKLGDKKESELEKQFLHQVAMPYNKIGQYTYAPNLVKKYEEFLVKSIKTSLKGKTIVLDCACGASYKIAPAVFRKHGAKIISTFCKPNGLNINEECGATNVSKLQRYVLKYKADMGFAYDGDSDRLIAIDEKGNIVDGDQIMYMLAKVYKSENKLINPVVVGTRHTNMGVEKALNKIGIKLIRTDIGDKYVIQAMQENNLQIGGEQSGHILVKDLLPTGDGILNSLLVAEILVKSKQKFSSYFDFENFVQTNINVKVCDKMRIINNEELAKVIEQEEKLLGQDGRIMVRVSGTEQVIRIMVESLDREKANKSAKVIEQTILKLNRSFCVCVE